MKPSVALALAAALAFAALFTGCGSGTPAAGKQLPVQSGPDPKTVDPTLNSTIDGATMLLHAFETLLTLGETNEIRPGPAERWEKSEDGMVWTFRLREGLKWSDGTDLTAQDHIYSWKRVVGPATAAPYADAALGMVKGFDEAVNGNVDALGVSAPDALAFVAEPGRPCMYFEQIAAFVTLSPVQRATVEANGGAWSVEPSTYVSNGPFRMAQWAVSSHTTFEKNPYYWDAGAVKLDRLKFLRMEDAPAAYTVYQTDEVLLIKNVPTDEIPSMKKAEDGGDFYVEPIMETCYLNINLERQQFRDVRVRKALSLAIDRGFVASTLTQGTYTAASNLIDPGLTEADGSTPFMEKANGGRPYMGTAPDLEQAKALLTQAGYPGGAGFPLSDMSSMTRATIRSWRNTCSRPGANGA